MVDDTAEQRGPSNEPASDAGRTRRSPPTIDLQATAVTQQGAPETPAASVATAVDSKSETERSQAKPSDAKAFDDTSSSAKSADNKAAADAQAAPGGSESSPGWIAPLVGVAAVAAVVVAGWGVGLIPLGPTPPWLPSRTSKATATDIEDLTARLTALEARTNNRPAAATSDQSAQAATQAALQPALQPVLARLDALEKSVAAVRGEVSGLRAQSDKLTAALNEAKPTATATTGEPAAAPDLSDVNERIARVEQAVRAQGALIATDSEKVAAPRPADDVGLRRVVAASLLDLAVRNGEPYAALLATAKSLAPNADALKPLEAFAASGVPSPAGLDRELLTLVPKLSPPAPENPATGPSFVDRLQAGAAKLVRIERTDAPGTGNDRGAIVARVTAAAVRNDFAEARRDLNILAPADRAAAQGWLDKADARDAALAASRHFADEAMASLAKPAQ
jgi:hypothetical protein